jgi:hypothetical protein
MIYRAGLVLRVRPARRPRQWPEEPQTRTLEAGAAMAGLVLSQPMNRISVLSVLAGAALLTVACAKEPTEALNAAKAALDAAKTAEAADYAPAALAAAETASAALEAELKAQGEKLALTRSYTKAAELAAAAKAAADAAAAEAVTGKEQMKTEATTLIAGVRSAIEAAKAALAKAPRGKGTAADLEAMKGDVAGVEAALADMDAALAAGKYKDAKVKAEAAKATLDKVVADVQAAIDAKKG